MVEWKDFVLLGFIMWIIVKYVRSKSALQAICWEGEWWGTTPWQGVYHGVAATEAPACAPRPDRGEEQEEEALPQEDPGRRVEGCQGEAETGLPPDAAGPGQQQEGEGEAQGESKKDD